MPLIRTSPMTPSDLVTDLKLVGPHELSVVLYFLAERVYCARTNNGGRVLDASDFKVWLMELAELAAQVESTKVQSAREIRTRPRVMHRPGVEDFCPRCGHVHQGSQECGEQIGGGRICRCEMEVSA